MALPATGSTITMNQVQVFFGRTSASTVTLRGDLGPKIGITSGAISLSASFGGLQFPIISSGLVLYLDAANSSSYPGSGSTWFDLSGNGNNLTWNSPPTYNSNGYFVFNGTSHYGTITNSSSLNFSSGQTLIIGMYHDYTSGRRNPWDQAYGGYGTWTHEQGNNITHFYGDAGSNAQPYVGRNSGTTPRNVWNIMCTTRDTSQSKWYLNTTNTDTYSHPYGTLTATAANIRIGLGYAGYWQGSMAFVAAYNRALTAAEVAQNFNALRARYGL